MSNHKKAPFFSIGITTFDRVDLLKETLHSIIWQTFGDFEIIIGNDNQNRVVDAGMIGFSDDRIRYVNHPENLGCLGNMNALLKMARGQFFAWFADDDMLLPSYLQKIYSAIERFGPVKYIYTSFIAGKVYPESIPAPESEPMVLSGREWLEAYLSRRVKTQGCSGMIEIKHLQQLGGIRQLGDYALSPYSDNLLAIEAGSAKKVVYIPDPLFFYRLHKGSVSAASTEIDAYSSAQKQLISKSASVFESPSLRGAESRNMYLLFRWFVDDYFTVMKRSERVDIIKIISYLLFIMNNRRTLRGYRYRLTGTLIFHIGKLFR